MTVRDGGFGVYVHWPFCQAKCPYCDFNSHVVAHIDQSQWVEAYRREIARYQQLTSDLTVGSVYFGGGTPSLMSAETVAAVLDAISQAWDIAPDLEVTLEANPTSVEAARFAGYRAAGVNRVSLGLQALNDTDLRRLGRLHSAAEGLAAFDVARREFDRVSFDLIYARQDQNLDEWLAELDLALARAADHLSLYQLTIEPGTAFWDRQNAGKLKGLPQEDLAADLYDATLERCASAGFSAYEVSNLARAGAESRHNLVYWSAGSYVGIGPGAHGRLDLNGTRWATEAERMPGAWLKAARSEAPTDTWHDVTDDRLAEYLMMGLRTEQGVRCDWVTAMGADAGFWTEVDRLTAENYLQIRKNRIQATPNGRIVLNALLRELLI